MNEANKRALIALPIVWVLAIGLGFAGSQNSIMFNGFPLFGLIVMAAFAIQFIMFIPAFIWQTEKYFDLTGSLTYISLTLLALLLREDLDTRAMLLGCMVILWALRLGSFLFLRIKKEGKDGRFDELKPSFVRFLNVWNIQGLWVSLTAAAAFATLTSASTAGLEIFAYVGGLMWLVGFVIEVIADDQKRRFKNDPASAGKFINVGLWRFSRHPNYFGEILLWTGILVMAFPVLSGWQWVVSISPVFVALLLIKVSGVAMVEKRSDDKWGDDPAYQEYMQSTPMLIPKLKK